jgi:hypothetical protein
MVTDNVQFGQWTYLQFEVEEHWKAFEVLVEGARGSIPNREPSLSPPQYSLVYGRVEGNGLVTSCLSISLSPTPSPEPQRHKHRAPHIP